MVVDAGRIPMQVIPALHREQVTAPDAGPTVHPVADADSSWPAETFNRYLGNLMKASGIADYAELSRLSGVNQTNLSNYKLGRAQPSIEILNRLADVLQVKPVLLWIQAGRVSPSDLDLSGEPRFEVAPPEVRELAAIVEKLPESDRRSLLDAVSMLIAGYRPRARGSKSRR